MSKYKYFLLCVSIILFSGCAIPKTNLSPVLHKDKPRIRTFKAPELDNIKPKTFSVFPVSRLKTDPLLKDDRLETHMLFLLRNTFEIRGYRYVELAEDPDFLATIDGHVQQKKGHVIPKTLRSPKWFAERKILDAYISSDMTRQNYTVPNEMVGTCYPIIRIDALEPKTQKPLWAGIGIGKAGNSDLRVSSQTLVIFLLGEFPKGPFSYERIMTPFGFGFFVFTNNGNDYYPTVFELIADSPADKAGMRLYDMILSIDGISVKNRPVSEIIDMFKKESGRKKSFTMLRLDKKIDLEILPKFH